MTEVRHYSTRSSPSGAGRAALGIDAEIEKVTDYPAIIGYGVMSTPGLVVDEKVVLSGRVPTAAKVRELLESLTS